MGTSLAALAATALLVLSSLASAGTYGRIEASFELPHVTGNPFDFTVNDVRVTLAAPSGKTVELPAFFDGGTTWRVRHAPTEAGIWSVKSVALNGKPIEPKSIAPRDFNVPDKPAATRPTMPSTGYVRIDSKDKMRFAFDDGTPYLPVGYDLAWHHTGEPKMGPLTESVAKMSAARVNWTRIWMNAWDGKNLDWLEPSSSSPKPGTLDLGVAKHWDQIIDALDAGGVRFQMVLQHHGQYSTTANENWTINPWNVANGGFLDSPVKFFSDEQARKFTRAKYRYIIARWGYSPSIMAWELFNEVQFTDAFKADLPGVAAWHAEMAKFIREQDPYKHLITTSSQIDEKSLWPAMDYYQDHVYAPDLITAVLALESKKLDKPYFYGEIGSNAFGPEENVSDVIHRSLWTSLMTNQSGAAMYWTWYEAEPRGLLYHYTAAQKFLEASKLVERGTSLSPIEVIADAGSIGPLKFGPGSGWAPATSTRFVIKRSGVVENLGGMSSYLQGTLNEGNRKMFPFAEFEVDFPRDGTFAVRFDEMTGEGAKIIASVDGKPASTMTLGAPPRPQTTQPREQPKPRIDVTLELPIAAGKHVIRLENQSKDWIKFREFTLAPYAPPVGVLAKGTKDYAAIWVYRRDNSESTTKPTTQPAVKLSVPGLETGEYRVVFFDTMKGVSTSERMLRVEAGRPLILEAAAIASDVAIVVAPVSNR